MIEIYFMKEYKQVLILIVFVVFSWVDLSAQLNTIDAIYLKNGSVIRGKILEQTSEQVKIETNCENIFVFETDQILEIKKETTSVKMNQNDSFSPKELKGFYNYSTFGLMAGNSEETKGFSFTFQTTGGYNFSQFLGVGLGVGLEELKTELVPVFFHVQSHLLNKPNTPFVDFQIGYSFPLSETKSDDYSEYNYDGGLNLGFDFGICSYKSSHRAFSITAGYRYQLLKESRIYNYYYWGGSTLETTTYEFNKIVVRLGFMFR